MAMALLYALLTLALAMAMRWLRALTKALAMAWSGFTGIEMFNNQQVRKIDDIPTIITNLKGNVAKGFILNNDFTLSPCFVVKHNSIFAHGETLQEARQALESKLFDEMEVEERIEMFLKN